MSKKSLFLILSSIMFVIVALVFVKDSYTETVTYSDFTGGVRNDITADLILNTQTPDAENVITNENGTSLKKRGGFTLYKVLTDSITYPVQGITSFREQSTGNDYFIVAHGLYLSKVTASSNTDFYTARTSTTYEDFTFNDKDVYGCNGYDKNWYYDGTTFTQISSYTVTSNDTPIYISTLTSSGTTATAITSYTITNLIAGDSVLIAGVTNYTSYNGTFVINSVLGTSSFTYTLASSTGTPAAGTSITATNSVTRYEFPNTFTHSFYQDRYFIACTTSSPNTVWQSYYNQPTNFTTYDATNPDLAADQYDIGASGERIVKLVPYNAGLMVFKSKSIYKIIGDATPMQIIEITHELGCNNPNSIIEDNGLLYFFGSDNYYYMYDGSVLTRMSQNVQNTTKYIPQTIGKLNLATWDTFSDFNLGTTTNTYLSYDGKILPAREFDTFNDGDYNGWTTVGSDIKIETRNTDRKNNQYFVFTKGSSHLRKIASYGDPSEMLGDWYYDVYFDTITFSYPSSPNCYVWLSAKNANNYSSFPNYGLYNYFYVNNPNIYNSIIGRDSTAFDSLVTANNNFHYKIKVSSSSTNVNSYFNVKLYINGNFIKESDRVLKLSISEAVVLALGVGSSYYNAGASYIYKPIKSTDTCTYVSEIKDMGSSNYVFSNFNVNQTLNGKTINYYMRTNASSTSITSDSWISVNNNSQITLTPAQYIQWKAEFITDDASTLPELDSVSIQYLTTTEQVIAQGVLANKFYKNRMYSSVTNNEDEGTTYNNYGLVFDLLTGGIWQYDGFYLYDFSVLNNELYAADARYGVLLKYSDSNFSDYDASTNSSVAISAYYYTKRDYLVSPFNKKRLDVLSLGIKAQSSGSLLIDYLVQNITSKTLTYSMISSDPTIFKTNRYARSEKGNYFQWKFYNTTIDEDFELYMFSTSYTVMPYEVSK